MTTSNKVYAIIDYGDSYVQPLLIAALQARLPADLLVLINNSTQLPADENRFLQWRQYEEIDFEHLMTHSTTSSANSYIIRKALIRKHYLSNTISHWLSKHRDSDIKQHVQPSIEFEVDFAEFLDDALLEAYELHESWTHNQNVGGDEKQWWILKPGMSDRGQGIRLFSSEEELTTIFEAWDPPSDDEDEEVQHSGDEDRPDNDITTSQLRHFVAQPYIHPPLLLPAPHPAAGSKFHIRVYVLAVGALKVYVYKPMLALFAGRQYTAPAGASSNEQLDAHLTNTCLQDSQQRDGVVHPFWSLPSTIDTLPNDISVTWQQHVWDQICRTTATTFEAAARTSSIHFQPLPNAFEIFGLDYLVDSKGCAWLLEVNAFPDFAQTGPELGSIIGDLMQDVVSTAVLPFFKIQHQDGRQSELVEVLDMDLGRR